MLTANSLAIETSADFQAGRSDLSRTNVSLAGYLQGVFDQGAPGFDAGFARIATINGRDMYSAALGSISGQVVNSMAAIHYEASQWFARSTYGCPAFAENSTLRTEYGCVWFRLAGVSTDRYAERSFPGYDWSAVTAKVGGQKEIEPGLFLGGSVAYETGDLKDKPRLTRVDSDAALAAVSLTWQSGAWTLSGALDIGYGWFDSRRAIPLAGDGARAKSSAFNVGLHSRAAYREAFARFYVEPLLELDANYVTLDGYTQRGSTPFNLQVGSTNDVVLAATPGLKVGTRVDFSAGVSLEIYAGGGVRFLHGNNFAARARFASVSPEAGSFRTVYDNNNVVGRLTGGVQVFTAQGIDV